MVKKRASWKRLFKDESVVYLDTSILIYFFQNHEKYSKLLDEMFDFLEFKKLKIYFSSLLLTELLVGPFRAGQSNIAKDWLTYFKINQNLDIIDLTPTIAVDAAFLRAKYNIKTPDSIHLASAMQNQKSLFLTNDNDLKKIKEVNVVCIEDLANHR